MADTKAPNDAKLPHGGDHDRVVMASLKADGSADQTPDYTYIGDKEFAVAAAKRQRAEQAVSAADVVARGVTAGDDQGSDPDPVVAKLVKEHESVKASAEKTAEADVNARFEALRDA